jgi:hypothetical protein
MSEETKPGPAGDSLDRVELLMAIEEAFIDQIQADPAQRERLIREIEARMERGEFGDDALAALVRKVGPHPRGQAGAAVQPEELFFE